MKKIISSKLVLFLIALLLGYYLNHFWNIATNNKIYTNSKKLEEILEITNKFYIEDINIDTLTNTAIYGILKKLDPHSSYLTYEEFKTYYEEMSGKFVGIGIEFTIINDTLNVMSVMPAGPSDKVGIISGDKIIKVDNKNIIGLSTEKIINILRGKENSTVNLTIKRNYSKELINFIVKREEIILHPVDYYTLLNKDIGYIKIVRFSDNTYSETTDAISNLLKQGAKKFLIDLRNNPGGYLEQAVKVSDLFLPPNKLIVSIKGRNSKINEDFYATEKDKTDNIPLIVLVDNGSASASEIVAGAIQDWDRGLIVGHNTFGKGLVQQSFILNDNSEFRITLAKYYTPSGRLIQRDYKNLVNYYSLDEINKIDSSHSYKFTTKGKKVFSGMGIIPDVIIPLKIYDNCYISLLKNNIFYKFIYENNDFNNLDTSNLTLDNFKEKFKFSDLMFNKFTEFAKKIDKGITSEQLIKNKEIIISKIESTIANKLWGKKGRYLIETLNDPEINYSIKYFN